MTDNMFKTGKFDGSSKLNFQTYKRTLLAVAGIKDFDDALNQSLPINNPRIADYPDYVCKWKLAWSYLSLTLDGPAAAVLDRTTSKEPYDARQALCAKYKPATVEAYNQII